MGFRERFAAKHGKWPKVGDEDGVGITAKLFEAIADQLDAIGLAVDSHARDLKGGPLPPVSIAEAIRTAERAGHYEAALWAINEIMASEGSNSLCLTKIGRMVVAILNRGDLCVCRPEVTYP